MINKQARYTQTLWPCDEHTYDMTLKIRSEQDLISASVHLGARTIGEFSSEEKALSRSAFDLSRETSQLLREQILRGSDPLGEALSRLRTPQLRRGTGATYTPAPIVEAMVSWASALERRPERVVEPGAGSGRFLLAAAKAFPEAELVGVETDPLAAMIARANLAVVGCAGRALVHLGDYRQVNLPLIAGKTLYIGNPPYVRHHQIDAAWKTWLSESARKLGLKASQLAGLHVHFFLATVLKARKDDFGAFITSAEWLDVNYGKLLRNLFLDHLGGQGITLVEPTTRTFSDAASTAAITQFIVGSYPEKIRMSRSIDASRTADLANGKYIQRSRFIAESRWSTLTRGPKVLRDGYIQLGELCLVHRGQVTGANRIWIAGSHSSCLPESVLFPSVTRAKELFAAGSVLSDLSHLKDVIDIPSDLSLFDSNERKRIDDFLARAKAMGADSGYVAKSRKAWWSVGLRSPAPILATYMARRKPAFVRNLGDARHINIAHGIYPRVPLAANLLDRLAQALSSAVSLNEGRTYAGGLVKFEPKEMERIMIPNPMQWEPEQVA